MGFTERTAGIPATTKMVMSFWFMVPAEVLSTVGAGEDPEDFANDGHCSFCYSPPLDRVVPLFTFGSQEVGTAESALPDEPCSPSFVGIDCFGDDYTLVVNLQMSNFATGDVDTNFQERPECFYMGGGNGQPEGNQRTTIVGGQKHHALISFDLSSSCSNTYDGMGGHSISPGPTFTWALDGESKVGESMAPSGDWDDIGGGATGIIPQSLLHAISSDPGSVATWSSTSLDLANPMGFPANADWVTSVFGGIKMSEVQIFTDVSVDCRDSEVIEAFRTTSGRPAHPSLAVSLLGKSPEIYFRTHTDWITGNNSGTAGDFTPTGTILETTEPA